MTIITSSASLMGKVAAWGIVKCLGLYHLSSRGGLCGGAEEPNPIKPSSSATDGNFSPAFLLPRCYSTSVSLWAPLFKSEVCWQTAGEGKDLKSHYAYNSGYGLSFAFQKLNCYQFTDGRNYKGNRSLKLKGLVKPNKSLIFQVRTPMSGEVKGLVLSPPDEEAASREQDAASSLFTPPSTKMPMY